MLRYADILYQYEDLSSLQSDPSVKIHGALMHSITKKIADKMHSSLYHPFSLYCVPTQQGEMLLRISSLNDEAGILIDKLKSLKKIKIYGGSEIVQTNVSESHPIQSENLAGCINGDKLSLNFLTPATVRSVGKYQNPPTPEKYFYSAICKLNCFENLSVSNEEFIKAWNECRIINYSLESCVHYITGYKYYGMCGSYSVKLPEKREQSDLLKKIFQYSVYSGVGGKTTQGMGGFVVTVF